MGKNEDRILSKIELRTNKRNLNKTQKLLNESQDLYRGLFENSHDAIFIINTNGKFVNVNPAFLDLFEYSENDLKRINIFKLYIDPNKRKEFINKLKGKEFLKDFEVKLRRSNGSIIDCLIFADARTSQDGNIIGYQGIIHDVTDKIRSEKIAINLQWTLDKTLDSIFIFDPVSLQFTYVNQGGVDQVGYSKEELLNITPLDIKPEFREESFRIMLNPLITGEKNSLTFETVHRKINGDIIPVEVFLQYNAPPDSKPQILEIVRDISKRKERDDVIKNLSYVIDQSTDSIMITDRGGNIEYVNSSFEKVTGYVFDEVRGKTPRMLKSGEIPREEFKKIWEIISSGKIWTGKFHNKKKNGELYWERASIFPIKNSSGVITHYMEISYDLSNQNKVEDKFHQSEKRFRSLVDSVFDAIISTNEEGNIVSWNIAAEEIFGYSASEIIGDSLVKIMPRRFRNALQEGMKHLIQGGDSKIIRKTVKLNGIRKNGSEFPIELSLSSWKFGGKIYLTEFIEDITERLKIEENLNIEHELVNETNKELRKAFAKEEKLRSALINSEKLASLGEMASKISHEINNPLTVIKAQAEIQAQMATDEALKESLTIINVKADQIKDLTRGYMNLAKPVGSELKKIKLQDVLRATVNTLLPLGQLKNIEISEKYMKDEHFIFGNSGKLEQVFRNLIINAVDAMEAKSSKRIKIGTKLTEDEKSVDAYIKDNGTGIEEKDLEKIFEPYYTTKERAEGTGLGLVIVKETIKYIHGGKLNVESNLGRGTEFHVIIPTVEYTKMRKKLLIVDDDVDIAELLADYFSNKGLKVKTAENGKIALEVIKIFNPDLILSDIKMPYLDGIGLLKEVIKINSDLPFVMMTGFDSKANLKDKLGNQGVPLILKPPDLEDELWPTIKEKLEIA